MYQNIDDERYNSGQQLGGAQGIAKFGNADLVACPSLHINSTN
ncbi:MAG: hypothetical protein WAK17_13560 [Candidatus Nitrosopolaris sp.]|jgi:hypothetical protein